MSSKMEFVIRHSANLKSLKQIKEYLNGEETEALLNSLYAISDLMLLAANRITKSEELK